jgi:hypothetical protein
MAMVQCPVAQAILETLFDYLAGAILLDVSSRHACESEQEHR